MPWTPYLAATSSNGVSINAPMALVQFLYDNVTPTLSGFKQRREQTRQPSSDCARRSLPEEAEKQSLPPGFGLFCCCYYCCSIRVLLYNYNTWSVKRRRRCSLSFPSWNYPFIHSVVLLPLDTEAISYLIKYKFHSLVVHLLSSSPLLDSLLFPFHSILHSYQ